MDLVGTDFNGLADTLGVFTRVDFVDLTALVIALVLLAAVAEGLVPIFCLSLANDLGALWAAPL